MLSITEPVEVTKLREWTPRDSDRPVLFLHVKQGDDQMEYLVAPELNGGTPAVGSVTCLIVQTYKKPVPRVNRDGESYVGWQQKDRVIGTVDPELVDVRKLAA